MCSALFVIKATVDIFVYTSSYFLHETVYGGGRHNLVKTGLIHLLRNQNLFRAQYYLTNLEVLPVKCYAEMLVTHVTMQLQGTIRAGLTTASKHAYADSINRLFELLYCVFCVQINMQIIFNHDTISFGIYFLRYTEI